MRLVGRRPALVIPLVLVAVAVLAFTLLNRPTTAQLKSTDPTGGATLDTAPDHVTFTFTVKVSQLHVTVTGADATRDATVDGKTATQPLANVQPGAHSVSWHVYLLDGGQLSGTLTFAVRASQPTS